MKFFKTLDLLKGYTTSEKNYKNAIFNIFVEKINNPDDKIPIKIGSLILTTLFNRKAQNIETINDLLNEKTIFIKEENS
jgi:hypothetical protein